MRGGTSEAAAQRPDVEIHLDGAPELGSRLAGRGTSPRTLTTVEKEIFACKLQARLWRTGGVRPTRVRSVRSANIGPQLTIVDGGWGPDCVSRISHPLRGSVVANSVVVMLLPTSDYKGLEEGDAGCARNQVPGGHGRKSTRVKSQRCRRLIAVTLGRPACAKSEEPRLCGLCSRSVLPSPGRRKPGKQTQGLGWAQAADH